MTSSIMMDSTAAESRPVLKALSKQKERDAEELLLDGTKLKDMNEQDAADIHTNAQRAYLLSMNQCRLKDLRFLPYLPNIEVLELQDNSLNEYSNLQLIPERFPNATELLLSGNHISDIESLSWLLYMPKLHNLELNQNPLTKSIPDYRKRIFAVCSQLGRIDDVGRDGAKADSDQEDVEAEKMDDIELEAAPQSLEEIAAREQRRNALADFYEKDLIDDDEDDEDFDAIGAEEDEDDEDDDNIIEE